MALTGINSEDRLVQKTFADHLRDSLGWETIYAHNTETFGPNGTLGRDSERDVVLPRELRSALERLNPQIPPTAREQAVDKLIRGDLSRSLRDAVNACYTSDEAKRRFEIIARQVFVRMKALLMEPSAYAYAERHDNIEAIYRKLQERRDTADVTQVLKELHRIVNEAIRAQEPGGDRAEGLTVDLSKIDFEKLREEFARKIRRKNTALQDIRDVVERKLAAMLATNPLRMDYYRRYQEIIADYNREKDRATVEATFAALIEFVASLDVEQERAAREGLSELELALFDLLQTETLTAVDRERVKQTSRHLLSTLRNVIASMPRWTETAATQAEVETTILDELTTTLPQPPFEEEEIGRISESVYEYIWQRSASGTFGASP